MLMTPSLTERMVLETEEISGGNPDGTSRRSGSSSAIQIRRLQRVEIPSGSFAFEKRLRSKPAALQPQFFSNKPADNRATLRFNEV